MSETKYSVSRSPSWSWVHEKGNPRFTDHALDRYDERTLPDSISPERAWEESVEMNEILHWFNRQSHLETDRVRFYAGLSEEGRYGVAFPVTPNGNAVESILTVHSIKSFSSRPIRAFLHSVAQ